MAIQPTNLPPPIRVVHGVTDTGRSMDRDARERTSYGPQHQKAKQENKQPEETGVPDNSHIIDESA